MIIAGKYEVLGKLGQGGAGRQPRVDLLTRPPIA